MGSKAKYRKYNLLKLNEETHKDDVFYKELPIDNKDFDGDSLLLTLSSTGIMPVQFRKSR